MKIVKIVFVLIVSLVSFSAFSSYLTMYSNPKGASVYVLNPTNNQRVKIGKTPFKMGLQEIVGNFSGSEVFMLEVEKTGYEKIA